MSYLTPKHEQLARQQQSSFMQWFGQLPFDKKIAAIGVSLTIGVTCAAASWTQFASDRIYCDLNHILTKRTRYASLRTRTTYTSKL
ncbi:hypothetical protein GTQ43_36485 [Nostoc sp. KVJ3]|uniref:hypothetical protein n=1 Tax=Nostoc sp. KVJ3 TaxID=457945 RepID=UPI0022386A52|nr:hypothetical protein [Nostoc sp. KVJ3]MCW5318946.1 hypothetical protein [Nostoc sp. KVJ3]